jgi:hypothetical protein
MDIVAKLGGEYTLAVCFQTAISQARVAVAATAVIDRLHLNRIFEVGALLVHTADQAWNGSPDGYTNPISNKLSTSWPATATSKKAWASWP